MFLATLQHLLPFWIATTIILFWDFSFGLSLNDPSLVGVAADLLLTKCGESAQARISIGIQHTSNTAKIDSSHVPVGMFTTRLEKLPQRFSAYGVMAQLYSAGLSSDPPFPLRFEFHIEPQPNSLKLPSQYRITKLLGQTERLRVKLQKLSSTEIVLISTEIPQKRGSSNRSREGRPIVLHNFTRKSLATLPSL